jgi:hypothetical protein
MRHTITASATAFAARAGDDAARRCERVTTRTWGFWVGAEVWIGTWSGDRVGYYSLP